MVNWVSDWDGQVKGILLKRGMSEVEIHEQCKIFRKYIIILFLLAQEAK